MNAHDRSPVRRNKMKSTTESEKNATTTEAPQPKAKRASAKKLPPTGLLAARVGGFHFYG
jgi:hypothetical protein